MDPKQEFLPLGICTQRTQQHSAFYQARPPALRSVPSALPPCREPALPHSADRASLAAQGGGFAPITRLSSAPLPLLSHCPALGRGARNALLGRAGRLQHWGWAGAAAEERRKGLSLHGPAAPALAEPAFCSWEERGAVQLQVVPKQTNPDVGLTCLGNAGQGPGCLLRQLQCPHSRLRCSDMGTVCSCGTCSVLSLDKQWWCQGGDCWAFSAPWAAVRVTLSIRQRAQMAAPQRAVFAPGCHHDLLAWELLDGLQVPVSLPITSATCGEGSGCPWLLARLHSRVHERPGLPRHRLQREEGPAPGAILEQLLLRAGEEHRQCHNTVWSTVAEAPLTSAASPVWCSDPSVPYLAKESDGDSSGTCRGTCFGMHQAWQSAGPQGMLPWQCLCLPCSRAPCRKLSSKALEPHAPRSGFVPAAASNPAQKITLFCNLFLQLWENCRTPPPPPPLARRRGLDQTVQREHAESESIFSPPSPQNKLEFA